MVNWLVIGVGDITSKRVIPAIVAEPRSHLYGIVTRDPAKGRPYADKVWSDLSQALADPSIGIVYVGTPVFLHASQTLAALHIGAGATVTFGDGLPFAGAPDKLGGGAVVPEPGSMEIGRAHV